MAEIHSTAVIEPGAQIGTGCVIGPFCHIGPHVILEDDIILHSHVCIYGHTRIGHNTQIFPFASIGHIPQDKKYVGESSRLEIGSHNIIREHVTIQPGTKGGGLLTKVGNGNLLMVGVHIAHDCLLGDHGVFANNATFAGHVVVGDHVTVGGLSAIHQFVRIGDYAMIGGFSAVVQDVIPYGMVVGERAHLIGVNLMGLKRRGFSTESLNSLRDAYQHLFDTTHSNDVLQERIKNLEDHGIQSSEVKNLIHFMTHKSHRNFCMPKAAHGKN